MIKPLDIRFTDPLRLVAERWQKSDRNPTGKTPEYRRVGRKMSKKKAAPVNATPKGSRLNKLGAMAIKIMMKLALEQMIEGSLEDALKTVEAVADSIKDRLGRDKTSDQFHGVDESVG
jgi:hypothetical protein